MTRLVGLFKQTPGLGKTPRPHPSPPAEFNLALSTRSAQARSITSRNLTPTIDMPDWLAPFCTPAPKPDLARIRSTAELLQKVAPEAQLLALKNLILNNGGIWNVPENPSDYCPVLFEVCLFEVSAMATEANELPANWIRAALNTLQPAN